MDRQKKTLAIYGVSAICNAAACIFVLVYFADRTAAVAWNFFQLGISAILFTRKLVKMRIDGR